MKKNYILLIALCFMFGASHAQTADKKWGIGVMAGTNQYNGDLGNAVFDFEKAFYGFGSLSLHRYLSPSFNLGIQGTSGEYGFFKNDFERFKGNKLDAALLLSYKFNNGYILKEDSRFEPYATLGLGLASHSGSRIIKGSDPTFPIGAGAKYHLNDWMAIQYQFLYSFTNGDKRDIQLPVDKNDKYAQQSIGLSFSFGKSKDSDKDGVADKLDKCPNTPMDVSVDVNGCPIDSDGDGVADYIDKCPDIKGLGEFAGCPDTDGDGVQDSEDKCPKTKGLVVFNGCPDTDGDGIQDSEDKCPKVKGLASFAGCPDTDGDGIQDSEDKCPTIKGLTAMNGCPDEDGDGVADPDDKCPNVPGILANKGCPEVNEDVKKIFEQALTGIQFQSGSDVIKASSYSILDKVVNVMQDNNGYNLNINGHTDSQGNVAKNLALSQKRAESVKTYLMNKGISADRMTALGFGITQPIADNNTAAGRKRNRRVEFKVIF